MEIVSKEFGDIIPPKPWIATLLRRAVAEGVLSEDHTMEGLASMIRRHIKKNLYQQQSS